MADTRAEIILAARDETRAAFDSVNRALSQITGANVNLAASFKGVALAAAGLSGITSLAILKSKVDDAIAGMAGLKDASERTGAAVEKLSAIQSIAKIGGRDFGEIESGIIKLNKALHGTDDESKGAGKALAALGLDIKQLRSLDPADAFFELAKAQEKFSDGGGKSALMMAIMGKSAAALISAMHDIADAQNLVGRVTGDQARAADEYEKNIKRLQLAFGSLSKELAAAAVGPLKDITDWMVRGQKEGGLLEAAFLGVGAALVKAFGGEINPLKSAEESAASAFAAYSRIKGQVEAAQSDIDAGKFGILGEAFSRSRLEALKADLAKAKSDLDVVIRNKNRALGNEAAKDVVKDTSLDGQIFGKSEGEAKRDDSAKRLVEALDKKLAVMALDLQSTEKLTQAEKELAEIQQQLDSGTLKASARQKELILGKQEALVAYEKVLRAMDVEAAAQDRSQQQLGAFFDSLDEQARALEKQADLYGLTAAQIAVVTQSRLEDAVAQAKEEGASEAQIAVLERELDARRRITAAQVAMAEKQQLIEEQARKANDTLEEFSKQAARNIQDALADFLFDPFEKGTQGMLKSFGALVQKMIAQAVAADLSKKLFGDLIKGGEGEGLLSAGLSALGKAFGYHDGGLVGEGAATFTRTVPMAAFAGAQRYHSGGWPGLRSDEVPAILQRGERVLPRGAAAGGPTINVYVSGTSAPDIRRAAGQGAREALNALTGARRYG